MCELAHTCIFFNDMMGSMPETSTIMKARYCKASYHDCARYLVYLSLGRESVPDDLAPNDRLRGLAVVRHASHASTGPGAPR